VRFDRYIGIDYSGAQTPTDSLKGLRIYVAYHNSPPVEVPPPAGPKKKTGLVAVSHCGCGAARCGNRRWRRLTELRARTPKSVFFFDVQGSVAKSTHSGLPWLRYLRQQLGARIHFWPFDGWNIPSERSVLTDVYPSLCRSAFAREDRTADQHDAYSVAAWMRQADRESTLARFFAPTLNDQERTVAEIEGWILGVE
jgi:hypothetical protein